MSRIRTAYDPDSAAARHRCAVIAELGVDETEVVAGSVSIAIDDSNATITWQQVRRAPEGMLAFRSETLSKVRTEEFLRVLGLRDVPHLLPSTVTLADGCLQWTGKAELPSERVNALVREVPGL